MLSWRGTRSAQQKGAATTDDVYQPAPRTTDGSRTSGVAVEYVEMAANVVSAV